MTDQDLAKLEIGDLHKLAQKGAGLQLPKGWPWSPSTNDGDAFRLQRLVVDELHVNHNAIIAHNHRAKVYVMVFLEDYVLPYDGGINKGQAMRDAVVRLAAKIGAQDVTNS